MLLNQLFIDNPINFDKRCKTRIVCSCLLIVLGAAAVALSFLAGNQLPVSYLEEGHSDFLSGFYLGTGFGLICAAAATIIKNVRYLKNPKLRKEREIYESDERNRMLGLRCWAYTGYAMLFLLYTGILVSGFISLTVLKTLLVVIAVYGVMLLIFRCILQKAM